VTNRRDDARRWLAQAADDLRFARHALAGRFWAQACFVAQQVGEKAVKAVHHHRTARPVIGHSVHTLLRTLDASEGVTPDLLELGGQLDQYYVPTRYPDALPGVVPSDAFSATQARAAVRAAATVLAWARSQLRTQ